MPNAKTLLVVDDDPEIVTMLSMRLESRGYKVVTASDGKEALAEAKRRRPALIILDVMMPSKNGWEVARALKQDPVTESIKVIMLTAIGANVNELTSPLYGADAYFDKPFDFTQLEAKIAELLA
ncbi:MAG: response regulator [Myxococcales bacterium]|nr:response regulator [Myxococcales bacterium]